MKKDQTRGKLRVLRGRQGRQRRPQTGGHYNRPAPTACCTDKFEQTLRVILGAESTLGTLAFTEADPVRRKHAIGRSEGGVNFRPLVGGGTGKKVVQKQEWFALPVGVVNDLSARRTLDTAGKNRWRYDIGQRRLRMRATATQSHHGGAEQAGPETHAQPLFPSGSHDG
jgi:hypothetical protein